MDPVIDFLHRTERDHSLDGLPATWILAGFLLMLLTALVLAATGRSWKKWLTPASITFCLWWSGVMFGRGQPGSGTRMLALFMLCAILADPGWRVLRAALQPRGQGGPRT